MLHDVSKATSLIAKEKAEAGEPVECVPHDILGGQVLRARGLPEALAHVVEAHGHLDPDTFNINAPLTEAEIVCYADKRVTGTKIVSLEDRKAGLYSHSHLLNIISFPVRTDLLVRYSDRAEWMIKAFVLFEQLEEKINKHIKCGNVDLVLKQLS